MVILKKSKVCFIIGKVTKLNMFQAINSALDIALGTDETARKFV